ncbi:hypothetical protein KY290_026155 [Solanum tuberosum]|uniref:RNase H type-1 domain-containing protein n=1 Tax=Solanum tuberosum TaxID=4113 RepID=A0ABQ7UVL8_SOLTU|nr:hypothetical protein KY285_025027 [Solanum tuberosum]KAH0755885.1 hypothetical protein KY290_026155 [Solanum tuberosum]
MGALYHILPEAGEDEIKVENFTNAQQWDEQKLGEHLPKEYVMLVMTNIPLPKQTIRLDKPFWMLEASGCMLMKWCKEWGLILHQDVGIHIEGLQLSQVAIKWWTSDCCPILKPLMIIIWNLWKRRNSLKHGRPSSYDNLDFKGEDIREGTNLEAEAIAIREALAHCVTEGIRKVCLETNSQVLIKFVTRVWKVPWNLAVIIDDIWGFSQDCHVRIQHVYKEELPRQARKIVKLDKQQLPTLRIRTKKTDKERDGEQENAVTFIT